MSYVQNINPAVYFVGQVADSNPWAAVVHPNTDTVNIPFGVAMINDSTNQGFILPTAANQITNRMAINGLVNRSKLFTINPTTGQTTIDSEGVTAPQGNCNGYVMGFIVVTVEQDVLQGDPCFIRFDDGNGGFTQKGAFRKDADTVSMAATAAVHPNWYYVTAAAAGTKAVVRVI